MTTYTSITNAQIDVDSPITQVLATLLRDNPIGIAEGATGAPRVARKTLLANVPSAGNAVITSLDAWGGAIIHLFSDGAATGGSTIELSTDGGSSYGATTALGAFNSLRFSIDFSSGELRGIVWNNAVAASQLTATVAGAGSGVDALRIAKASGPDLEAFIELTGGDTTT